MNNKNRDSIDFGKTDIPQLFAKLFVPTLMGLIFSALYNIADGVIVGHGVGSNALAAVNIAAPIFLISSSFSLMFASGVSIVGAVHLSQGNTKAACINTTQALTVPLLAMLALVAVMRCARTVLPVWRLRAFVSLCVRLFALVGALSHFPAHHD